MRKQILFFFIGASAIKSREKSRILRHGLPEDFLSKGQKTTGGVEYPPAPHALEGQLYANGFIDMKIMPLMSVNHRSGHVSSQRRPVRNISN